MSFLQLKVVIWKNLIIRKRHWLLTIIESVLPISIFVFVSYLLTQSCNSRELQNSKTEVHYSNPQVVEYSDINSATFYYASNTEFYQDIMERVKLKFQNSSIKGFSSTDSLLHYYESNNTITAAIIFHGNDEKRLDYTIRKENSYYSGHINTTRKSFESYPGLGTLNSSFFLPIQKALDVAFIEKISGRDLEHNITLNTQEFSYYSYERGLVPNEIFSDFLPIFTVFSFICLSPAILKRVVEEKYTGTKELMKMVGMKSWMLWLGWFVHGILPMLFSVLFSTLFMKIPFFNFKCSSMINTDGSILFVFLLLYCMAAIIFCFAISSFFRKPTIAMVAGIVIWILTYFLPTYGLDLNRMDSQLSWPINMLLNLLPNMALHYGYLAVGQYEQKFLGVQWHNFHKPGSGGTDDVTMLNVFVMLIVDMVIYMAFTMYMDGVNPGKYGVRRPILFPIYSLVRMIKGPRAVEEQQKTDALSTDYIEDGRGLTKGIEIQDLVKRFGPKVAVNNLTLDIFKNQITVLLGHNGAGKSTTMSIITGMLEMTSGSIKMNGNDIETNMDEIRKSLGLCPQHNLLFTDLTVAEHLLFFAKLKGRTAKESKTEMEDLLEKLHLSDKKNAMASTLSGGMKRKLCLGMAIIGGSEILILDEPTSGMDPESRRELWDLLLAWRGEKTILITTHFMEEADTLGDWIAIMTDGKLQCYGTPLFLKKAFDTGYHLSLIVKDRATAKERGIIKDDVIKHMDSAELKEANGNNMVFLLPLEDNSRIASLLTYLEDNKDKLQIENISVTITTLEDVFLKVKLKTDAESNHVPVMEIQDEISVTNSAIKLGVMRFNALVLKKLQFFIKKILSYLITTLIALLIVILTIYLPKSDTREFNTQELQLQLNTYKDTTVFYNSTKHDPFIERMTSTFRAVIEANEGKAMEIDDVRRDIMNKNIDNLLYYKEHLIAGAKFSAKEEIQATALYNSIVADSAPISLNLITTALAKVYLGDDYSITARNWPLETMDTIQITQLSTELIQLLWGVLIPIGFLLVIGNCIAFPHMELSTKFAQLQYMCGVRPYFYWLVGYLVDFVIYLIICIIIAAIATAMASFIGGTEFLVLLLILALYGTANIPFSYLFSRRKSASGGFAIFVIVGIFLGAILTTIVEYFILVGNEYQMDLGYRLKVLFVLVIPQVGLIDSLFVFSGKAADNYNYNECIKNVNPNQCKVYQSYLPPLQDNILLLLADSIIYILINILLDAYFVKKFITKVKYQICNIWYTNILRRHDGVNDYQNLNNSENEENYNCLEARNLHKSYAGKVIVKNIGFTLNERECLGILGVNGAGKTTTFRILTRDEIADSGSVKIVSDKNNKPISISQDKYLENLGYCPQTDALNFLLTGRQMLSLMAKLRGVDDSEIVDKFLKLFELEKYSDIPCGHYSGGNKRKLNLAMALMGYPRFVLLDEPTSGVDPSSRRKFWDLIRKFKQNKDLSVILTSHSMVECEVLCNNLKIMKEGRFEKEGTISELKKDHGGFNVKLKLVNKDRNDESNENTLNKNWSEMANDTFSDVEQLKEYFKEKHHGTVKDEHSGLLHIYIDDKTKKWSTMFMEVERIKARNPHLIEDYSISEASLEDIFLKVARSKNEEEPKKNKKKKAEKVRV